MYFQLKHCDPATISTVTTILRPLSTSRVNQAQVNGQLFTQASNLVDANPDFTLVHLARYMLTYKGQWVGSSWSKVKRDTLPHSA